MTKLIYAAILFLTSLCSLAYGNQNPNEIVNSYVQLDYEGKWLTADNSDLIKKLVDKKSLRNWEAWDTATITDKFTLQENKRVDASTAIVTVVYSNIGSISAESLQKNNTEETITFTVRKIGKTWKIVSPSIPPHVSLHALIKHYQYLISIQGDEDSKARLLDLNNFAHQQKYKSTPRKEAD